MFRIIEQRHPNSRLIDRLRKHAKVRPGESAQVARFVQSRSGELEHLDRSRSSVAGDFIEGEGVVERSEVDLDLDGAVGGAEGVHVFLIDVSMTFRVDLPYNCYACMQQGSSPCLLLYLFSVPRDWYRLRASARIRAHPKIPKSNSP